MKVSVLPKTNRYWVMTDLPRGAEFSDCFELRQEPALQVPNGCIATRNRYLSMDAGTRMTMTDREVSYLPPTPVGEKLTGTVLGEVVHSNHPDYRVGDRLRSWGQWADYSVIDPNAMFPSKVDDSVTELVNYVGILGANGWTAYVGVIETGRARAGDTFVVSAAAGCTGLLVGQIAKIAGCKVVGIAGSDEKCRLLCGEFGFDGAINYKTEDVCAQLERLCPEGVNVYCDNVGGAIAEAVFDNMALFGTVAVCGLLDTYGSSQRAPGPRNYDLVLMKRLRIEGFFSPDFYRREAEFNPILRRWHEQGLLKLPIECTQGLENLVGAYAKLFHGGNIGKVVVEISGGNRK